MSQTVRLSILLFAFFLTSLAPARVHAQTTTPTASSTPTYDTESGRFRFGVAGGFVLGNARGNDGPTTVQALALTPNVILDFGVQSNRHFALYLHLLAGTLILSSNAGAYGIAEYTPVRWLSLGTGVGYEIHHLAIATGGNEVRDRNYWSGVSVPLIAAFNFGGAEGWNSRQSRSVLRLAVEGALGAEPLTGIWGGRGALSFGAAGM